MMGYVAGSASQISLNDISAAGFVAFVASVRCDAYERLASKTAASHLASVAKSRSPDVLRLGKRRAPACSARPTRSSSRPGLIVAFALI